MKTIILAITIVAISSSAEQLQTSGEIRDLRVTADGAHTFRQLDNFVPVSTAPCAASGRYAILDENSTAGRSQMALLVYALSLPQNTISYVQGLGTCTRVPNHEDVDYIEIR